MRIPASEHRARPWVIAEIAPDFELLDVWGLPAEGGRGDFAELLEMMDSFDPAAAGSATVRALFWLRFRIGGWLGWDDTLRKRPIPGCRETSLRARLPAELRGTAARPATDGGPAHSSGGFEPLYRTDDEWAAEISNGTVHGVLHLTWVEGEDGLFRGRLAVYVKPRGLLGRAYLKLIDPFRHLIVYPALMRQLEREWKARVP